jgi:hypothetical protein
LERVFYIILAYRQAFNELSELSLDDIEL